MFFPSVKRRLPARSRVLGLFLVLWLAAVPAPAFSPDDDYVQDREALDSLQHEAFLYMWEGGDPVTGMAYEADFGWEIRPVAVGGTGFGVAAIVVAVDRGWITRDQAVGRLLKITRYLRDKTTRLDMHGAFPHWINPQTGRTFDFGDGGDVADTVETSLLMQGLLIARAYFNGPGSEAELRGIITGLWEGVDWNWFTNYAGEGIFWNWSVKRGYLGLRLKGYNECLITYIMAAASPTSPVGPKDYSYWTSGDGYRPKTAYGYRIEASLPGGGPLFLTHYPFIGLDPRRMADKFVPGGYFARNVRQVLSNRAYCLTFAPPANRYAEDFWGLTASQVKDGGYAASDPGNDHATIAPTGAISSMPYTPHYSLQVLQNLRGRLRSKIWGPYGPRDAISLKDDWVSPHYLAIDQLPMVSMIENYRTGLLWNLLMSDPEVRAGLRSVGITEPQLAPGFPEAVVTLKREGKKYAPDAYDIRRHPDSGLYEIPYWCAEAGTVLFTVANPDGGPPLLNQQEKAAKGRNCLKFPQFRARGDEILTLTMATSDGGEYRLPMRLY